MSQTRLGEIMSREDAEQSAVLERVLTGPRFALLRAPGTSDNAALFAK